jgi:hypothetical protein
MADAPSGRRLVLVDDLKVIGREFARWREALLAAGILDGKIWRLQAERIVFSNYNNESRGTLGRKVALGLDPDGANWAVQINEPKTAGSEDPTSGIGLDPSSDRMFLLRQGRLKPNNQSPTQIVDREFSNRTGLRPVSVTVGGKKARRDWYVVTALDLTAATIRRNTADFVDRCSRARTGPVEEAVADGRRLADLFGASERGGRSKVARNAWTGTVLREQGEVWLRLRDLLGRHNIELLKPRHAQGYEVDGEIQRDVAPLLIEMKTGSSAAEVYAGIGQLELYPKLLPRLVNHARILLLPKMPRPALADAIRECGVEIHTYNLKMRGKRVADVVFTDAFLKRCGVPKAP